MKEVSLLDHLTSQLSLLSPSLGFLHGLTACLFLVTDPWPLGLIGLVTYSLMLSLMSGRQLHHIAETTNHYQRLCMGVTGTHGAILEIRRPI